MRNLKRALSLTLASVMLLGMMIVGTSAASFPDVDENDNVEAIEVLAAVKVIVGDNGNFKPDDPVTRNEMAVIMAKLLNLDYNYYEATCPFTDVKPWARGWVGACAANGIIAGRSATTFDGDATVTAVEAAAMMMRALGYFKYDSDYADGFVVSTVRQASKIGLFADVNAGTNSPMTRNQVAQLALNTLEATIVDAQKTTADISVGSGETAVNISGQVQYVVRTGANNNKMTTAIKSNANTGAGGVDGTSGQTIELGEQLYSGDLQKRINQTDNMGRPAATWIYKNSTVGTYADDAEHTVYVPYASTAKTVKKMIEDIDKTYTTTDAPSGPNNSIPATKVYLNGDNNSSSTTYTVTSNAPTLYVGDRLEVFMDENNPGRVATIAITHWRADKMTGDTATRADGNDTLVRLPGVSGLSVYDTDNTTETVHGYQGLVADDIVLVYQDNNSEYWIEKAESFRGTLTAVESAGAYGSTRNRATIDGQKYDVSKADNYMNGQSDVLSTYNKDEATWYLDKGGNIVWVVGNQNTEVGYILAYGKTTPIYTGDAEYYVKLLTSNNEVVSVITKENYSNTAGSTIISTGRSGLTIGTVVNYTVSDGKYTLASIGAPAANTAGKRDATVANSAVQKGNPNVTYNSGVQFQANADTVFFIRNYDSNGAKDTFTSYTGYANVPSMKNTDFDVAGHMAAYIAADGYADYVFIDPGKTFNQSSTDLFYVVDNTVTVHSNNEGAYAWSVKGIMPAVSDEVVDIMFESLLEATVAKDTLYSVETRNSDNEISDSIKRADKDTVAAATKYVGGVGTGKSTTEVVVLGGVAYKYDTSTKFYRIDKNNKVTPIGANEIEADSKATFVAVRDNGTNTEAGYYFVKTVFIRESDFDPTGVSVPVTPVSVANAATSSTINVTLPSGYSITGADCSVASVSVSNGTTTSPTVTITGTAVGSGNIVLTVTDNGTPAHTANYTIPVTVTARTSAAITGLSNKTLAASANDASLNAVSIDNGGIMPAAATVACTTANGGTDVSANIQVTIAKNASPATNYTVTIKLPATVTSGQVYTVTVPATAENGTTAATGNTFTITIS